jgi:hypothetical protein
MSLGQIPDMFVLVLYGLWKKQKSGIRFTICCDFHVFVLDTGSATPAKILHSGLFETKGES